MHLRNIHQKPYDFKMLIDAHADLAPFVFTNIHGVQSIDFSNPEAVLALNKAILKKEYGVLTWSIPEGYLCPAIPSRVDYIHHIADVLATRNINDTIKGLDIGTGANCIYPILAAKTYQWNMVGCDIDAKAFAAAKANIAADETLSQAIEIRHQNNNANLFEGIIKPKEYFHFTMCNPPFYGSAEEAKRATQHKQKNLGVASNFKRNFGGEAHELWCNGGEALFLKRMIKQSLAFKNQVGVFTSLVAKAEHLFKIEKQLKKSHAQYQLIEMVLGNKKSRIVAWWF